MPGDLNYKYTKSIQFYQLVNSMEEGVNTNNTDKKFKLNDTQPNNLNFVKDDSQDFSITRQYEDIIYIPNVLI